MINVSKKLLDEISSLDLSKHNISLNYRTILSEVADSKEYIEINIKEQIVDAIGINLTIPFSLDALLTQENAQIKNLNIPSILKIIRDNAKDSIPYLISENYKELATMLDLRFVGDKYNL